MTGKVELQEGWEQVTFLADFDESALIIPRNSENDV